MNMMELTRKGDYAIRGIVYLARQPLDSIALLSEIATAVQVPQTFLAKIFQQFSKSGIVKSYRGTGGGFVLARPPEQITLLEVVETIEGPISPNRCVGGPGNCDQDSTCTVHPVWLQVQQQLSQLLAGVTLKDLAKNRP
jgi:Rrf2 family transcriptional regulator, iron-sulfur cluster assembly transcription factor